MTPVLAREERIRQLEQLEQRVHAELETERAALARVRCIRVDRAKVPTGLDAKLVRAWARQHGWPNLGDRGRLPAEAITAYLERRR